MEIGKHYKGYVHGKRLMLRCPLEYADELAKDGRIVTQYDIGYNRTGSDVSIDSICSRDGTVLGQISLPQTHRECIDTVTNAIKYFSVL
jgi:phosphoribosylformylglycinamidine (FGAM) synthase-like amidotransferase family enzyme